MNEPLLCHDRHAHLLITGRVGEAFRCNGHRARKPWIGPRGQNVLDVVHHSHGQLLDGGPHRVLGLCS